MSDKAAFSELKIEALIGKEWYQLLEPFEFKTLGIVVPKWFKTDFATIPRFLWSFLSSDDIDMREASVIHDYLYSQCYVIDALSAHIEPLDRKACDNALIKGMTCLGASPFKRSVVWLGVRSFGWIWFRQR